MPALARPYRHALSVAAGPPEEMRWGDLGEDLRHAPADVDVLAAAQRRFESWPAHMRLACLDHLNIDWNAVSSDDELQGAWQVTGWTDASGPWLSLVRTLRARRCSRMRS